MKKKSFPAASPEPTGQRHIAVVGTGDRVATRETEFGGFVSGLEMALAIAPL